MKEEYFSHAKVLLSGEYLVLDGVRALALPCKKGQRMLVHTITEPIIYWKSFNVDGQLWLEEEVQINHIMEQRQKLGASKFYTTLFEVLSAAHQLNPSFLKEQGGFKIECYLTFERLWGLGTSSTWINNIASWFKVNPYQLLEYSFKGSGYDIACANSKTPIFFTRKNFTPVVEKATLDSNITKNLYFVYLNQKQSSKEAIVHYNQKKKCKDSDFKHSIESINAIGQKMSECRFLPEFMDLMEVHEKIISDIIEQPQVKCLLFSDFPGAIKSLGAWGGDFILVASEINPTKYFHSKGYTTIINYEDFIV